MNKKIKLLVPVTILCLILTSCYNSREINTLAIGTALGIDKVDEGYRVTVQLINPSEIASKKGTSMTSPVIVYTETAPTIFEALRKITHQSPRKIYLSHLRIIVFGEKVARDGISKATDFIARDHEFSMDFFLLIAKDNTAENILKILTPLEKIPANKIFASLETSEKNWAPTKGVKLDELINSIMSDGNNPVLTGIFISGNEEGNDTNSLKESELPSVLMLDSIAAFKGEKLVGWLSEYESKGFNYITNNISNTVGNITIPEGGKVAFEVKKSKTKLTASFVDERPVINVEIKVDANAGEFETNLDLTKEENIRKVENLFEQEIKDLCNLAINRTQQDLKTDIFGFGEVIHRKYPKQWKSLKNNWNDTFCNITVNVNATVKIKGIGSINKPFFKEGAE